MNAVLVTGTGLTRRFGAKAALDGVDITVLRGEPVALFGANGAGKTTLLRMLAGALKPTSGELSVDRVEIGLVTHRTLLYEDLSAFENLAFFARLHGKDDPEGRARQELEAAGLADRAHDPVRTLSRGMQQRVALARALVHMPELLLLDEPSTGLDAPSSARLRASLAGRADRVTWVIASHDLEEGLALSRRFLLLEAGRIVACGLCQGEDADRLRARVLGAA